MDIQESSSREKRELDPKVRTCMGFLRDKKGSKQQEQIGGGRASGKSPKQWKDQRHVGQITALEETQSKDWGVYSQWEEATGEFWSECEVTWLERITLDVTWQTDGTVGGSSRAASVTRRIAQKANHTKRWTQTLKAVFTTVERWEQPHCPSRSSLPWNTLSNKKEWTDT